MAPSAFLTLATLVGERQLHMRLPKGWYDIYCLKDHHSEALFKDK